MKTKIYILNLLRSPHRKTHMIKQLKSLSTPFDFIQAIDGSGQSVSDFKHYNSVQRTKLYGRDLGATEIATTLSHLKAIKQAYADGVDWAVILEDDCVVLPTFQTAINSLNDVDKCVEVVRLYQRQKDSNFVDDMGDKNGDSKFTHRRFNYKNWGGHWAMV